VIWLAIAAITKAFVFLSNDDSSVWSLAKYKTKELLDIDDKMLFEYKIDDILASGIRDITFIMNATKESFQAMIQKVDRYKDYDFKFIIDEIVNAPVNALLLIKKMGINEAFYFTTLDDLVIGATDSVTKQLIKSFGFVKDMILGGENASGNATWRYDIIVPDYEMAFLSFLIKVKDVIPYHPSMEMSNKVGMVKRWVLTPAFLQFIEDHKYDYIGMADYLSAFIKKTKKRVFVCFYQGKVFDISTVLGYETAKNYFSTNK
jgi:UTP-glucose-1-phosphate uridylyltransferase